MRPAPSLFALLFVGLLGVPPLAAQEAVPLPPAATDSTAAPQEKRVGTITVVGNATVDSARIVRSFEVTPGSRFSADAVRRGIHKLHALGLFDDVAIDQVEHGDQIDLVVRVKERPRIGEIRFSGNKKRHNDDLEKKLFLKVDQPYNAAQVPVQVDSLVEYYHDQGFPRAHVTADATPDSVSGKIRLHFQVSEGERVRITRVEFAGVHAFPAKKLRKQLKTKARGFFGGGDFKDETFSEDYEKLAGYFRNHGYRDARVVSHELKPGNKPRNLTLVFTVEEGARYQIGAVTWTGNTVVQTAALEKLWAPRPDEVYDQSKIQKVQGLAYAEYAEVGYLYLNVDPSETAHDQKVDVAFAITEGAPSKVRLINIAGNLGTREKVIRREIDIHEGDRFKRSALIRSQGDIMRLGFFEDVQLDFAPAESSDVDLSIKVKEKQVGTASAGAGYTAQSGITGFLELGHNNVLGNGQSLSLHLERGSKRSEYYLSFTEPWFRDTPTLLGSSLFDTNRELDLYTEKRRGASGRIGRPLPWPDFSRGSIGYSLEDVTIKIDKPESTFTAQDTIVLRGLKNGVPVRTSSVNLNFLRNSANNPFYPTGGSRFSIESEVAGGPFGGSVNFHKHRVETKVYFPSLLKGVTTMVRARVGLIGEYADQHLDVPAYERFRLGGGTTPDPLRGYDDYMVVPEKFVRRVPIDTVDVVAPYDSVSTALVRYPGGRFMTLFSLEQQFPIAHPLHGVIFFDAGNTWDQLREIRPFDLRLGAGVGIRLEIPLLGNIGFDYGYGFDRRDLGSKPKFVGHFLIGQTSF